MWEYMADQRGLQIENILEDGIFFWSQLQFSFIFDLFHNLELEYNYSIS